VGLSVLLPNNKTYAINAGITFRALAVSDYVLGYAISPPFNQPLTAVVTDRILTFVSG
jgi:hypothetical protein